MMILNKFSGSTKKLLLNIINGIVVKGIAIIVGLLTIPAYLKYFENNTVLGVWFAILSVLSWILSFDLGIGNGLRNKIVVTLARNDEIETRKYISSAYIFSIAVSVIIFVLIFSSSFFIPWNKVFNVPVQFISVHDLRLAIIIVLLGIQLQFVLRIISSILYALQESYIPNLMALVTNIILLGFVFVSNLTSLFNNNIIILATVYLFAVNVPLLLVTIFMFATRLKSMKPSFRFYDINYAVDTLKVGIAFLGLQLEALIINSTAIFIVSWLLGSIYVVEYNVYFKFFSLISTVYSLITIPVWSAITRASAENNYNWIRKTTRVLQIIAIIFSLGQFMFFPIIQPLFNLWLGSKSIDINYTLVTLFALEQGIIIWSGICASICNGLNEMKWQFIWMTLGACLIFPLSMILTNVLPSYSGIVLAHILSLLPYCVGQTIWLEKFILRRRAAPNNGEFIA